MGTRERYKLGEKEEGENYKQRKEKRKHKFGLFFIFFLSKKVICPPKLQKVTKL